MPPLATRDWLSEQCDRFARELASKIQGRSSHDIQAAIDRGIALNRSIHENDCFNLNPATNAMNPRAEAALASGLGSRPSLGYPGDKYEMGLEGVEQVEIIAAELAAEVFGARYAEIRVPSGAIANLYTFMLAAKAGDKIIVPPPTIGGHVKPW
jgi:glycine hydroxymethyltransferase